MGYQGTEPSAQREDSNEDPVWSILPSYCMYTSTVSRTLNVPDHDDHDAMPPNYEFSRQDSTDSAPSNSSTLSFTNHPDSSASHTLSTSISGAHRDPQPPNLGDGRPDILADETTTTWQETILDNVGKLKNLTDTGNEVSDSVKVSLHFTKSVGKLGERPEFIDPSLYEYKEGDYIYGYVTICNTSTKAIPFEMLYLLFEGTIMVYSKQNVSDKRAVTMHKFLEMFDFSASWNDGHINRLLSENSDIYSCPNLVDPVDGTHLAFGSNRNIEPGRKYKRFFTFKIPSLLLDSACNDHNLSTHVQMPPSLGACRTDIGVSQVRDLSMKESAITYGVMARFIGRKSKYNVGPDAFDPNDVRLVNSKGDEYIILKEASEYVRLIQRTKILSAQDARVKKVENKLLHENLFNRVNEKLQLGRQLVKSIQENDIEGAQAAHEIAHNELLLAKAKQTYRSISRCSDIKGGPSVPADCNYEIFTPLFKRSLTGSQKPLGTLKLSSPQTEYILDYIPPRKFRNVEVTPEQIQARRLDIPLELTFQGGANGSDCKSPVDIKYINAELVVTNLRSDNHPIAIEFCHDLIFNRDSTHNAGNNFFDKDTFAKNMIEPMNKAGKELSHLLDQLGPENFALEKRLVDDLQSIRKLKEKIMNLDITDVRFQQTGSPHWHDVKNVKSYSAIPWAHDKSTNEYKKKLTVKVNLNSCRIKGAMPTKNYDFDEFCLVPNFQSCFMVRFYQIRLQIALTNNKYVYMKVPVTIVKR